MALVGGEKQMGHVYAERGSGVDVAVTPELDGGTREGELNVTMGLPEAAFGDTTIG